MIAQGPKWPALRFIAVLLKIIAWIELVLGIILALATGITGGSIATNISVSSIGGASFIAALIVLIGAVLGFIWTYASAEIIMLFITIEKNTRPR